MFWDTFGQKKYFDFFTLESDHGWDLDKFSKKNRKNHNFEKPMPELMDSLKNNQTKNTVEPP